ncbi:MAG: AraC family transcriptional regulator [Anaerolineaceae bacterium]|nr:AraC family transcriptional regulator [Anaerolineaceae bacterium]
MEEYLFQQAINRIYKHIETHLVDKIDIGEMAAIAGFSEFHFQRLFKKMLGISAHQFVRHVRLVSAAKRIAASDDSISDIAYQSGYGTLQSFSREFSKAFQYSPRAFRKKADLRLISFREQYLRIQPVGEAGLLPHIVDLPEQWFYYVCRKGGSATNSIAAAQAGFSAIQKWVGEYQLFEQVKFWVGQMPDEPDITLPDEQRYHAGVIFHDPAKIDPHIISQIEKELIAAGKWAVFRVVGPYEHLWQSWSAAFRDWLPASGFRLGNAAPFEIYVNSPQENPPEALITNIHLPIE